MTFRVMFYVGAERLPLKDPIEVESVGEAEGIVRALLAEPEVTLEQSEEGAKIIFTRVVTGYELTLTRKATYKPAIF